jgi:protein-disulfide isomerase
MSSREAEKKRAREARAAAEQAESASERRRRMIALLIGVLIIAVVVVGGLVLVSQSSDDPNPTASASGSLDGIPEQGITLGDPKAPVTLVEFADPQCPYCAAYTKGAFPGLVDKYVKSGEVQMQLRLLTFIGPDSETLASDAYSAADQGGLWKFIELAYARKGTENTGYVTDDFVKSVATDSGLDAAKVVAGADSSKVQDLLEQAKSMAQDKGVDSTPSFFVGPTGGDLQQLNPSSLDDVSAFSGPIDDALSAAGGT